MRLNKILIVLIGLFLVFSACSEEGHDFDPTGDVIGLPDDANIQVNITNDYDSVVFRARVGDSDYIEVIFTNTSMGEQLIISRPGETPEVLNLSVERDWYRIPMLEFHNEDAESKALVLLQVTSPDMGTVDVDMSTEVDGVDFTGIATGTGWPQPDLYGDAKIMVDGVNGADISWVNHGHEH